MAKRYRLGPARRVVNWIVRGLLAVGLGPPRTYLLMTRGRTTGRLYRNPVTLVEDLPRRWLVAPYGEVAWVKNARAAGRVTLVRGRRTETVRLVELDARESAPILQRYAREVPVTRPFFDARPDAGLSAFAAEAARHPVFELVR
jgi:deazaflavin-dependent oxidoreductase (nitroreductase family)